MLRTKLSRVERERLVDRAEALVVADVDLTGMTRPEADRLIAVTIANRGGQRGVGADLAQMYGDHPQETAARVRAASTLVAALYDGGQR